MELSLERMSAKLEKHLLGTAWGTVTAPVMAQVYQPQRTKRDCRWSWWMANHQGTKPLRPGAGCIPPEHLKILGAGNIKCITTSSGETVQSVYSLIKWMGGGGLAVQNAENPIRRAKKKNIADAPKPKAEVPRLGPLMHEDQLYGREQRALPFGRVLLGQDGTRPCIANAQYLCWARQTLILPPGQRK